MLDSQICSLSQDLSAGSKSSHTDALIVGGIFTDVGQLDQLTGVLLLPPARTFTSSRPCLLNLLPDRGVSSDREMLSSLTNLGGLFPTFGRAKFTVITEMSVSRWRVCLLQSILILSSLV